MWTYIFSGVIHPERAPLNLGGPIECNYTHSEAGLRGKARIEVYANQVILRFESELQVTDLATLRNMMTSLLSTTVEIADTSLALGHEVELRSVHALKENTTQVFGIDTPGLSPTFHKPEEVNILEALQATEAYPSLTQAFHDFRNAIRHPADTAVFCRRATEALSYAFNDDKLKAVTEMSTALGVDIECFETIRTFAGNPRHGKSEWISGEDRLNVLRMTQATILRAATYLKCKKDGAQFPIFPPLRVRA